MRVRLVYIAYWFISRMNFENPTEFNSTIYSNIMPGVISLWVICSIAGLISCIIICSSIVTHLLRCKQPKLQFLFFVIFGLVPVYFLSSIVCLFFPPFLIWAEAIRKVYEAVVIVVIYDMMVYFMGGFKTTREYMEKGSDALFCLKTSAFMHSFLTLGVNQYIVSSILYSVTSIICYYLGVFHHGLWSSGDAFPI